MMRNSCRPTRVADHFVLCTTRAKNVSFPYRDIPGVHRIIDVLALVVPSLHARLARVQVVGGGGRGGREGL